MEYIIGVSAYYHDSAACLFKDGELIFACEEERFTGIKHDNSFPENVVNFIFKNYNLTTEDISAVCYYEDPNLKYKRVLSNIKKQIFKHPIYSIKSLYRILKNKKRVKKQLDKISKRVFYSPHHLSHQYYSYFTSNFKNAVCLSVDGVGEIETLALGDWNEKNVNYYNIANYPHSLGLYYSAMTAFLGFKPNEGEYKLMGLASYGNPDTYIKKVSKLITYENDELKCNMDVFCWDRDDKIMFNHKLIELLGIDPRNPNDPITKKHQNLASAVQKQYEKILFDIIKSVDGLSSSKNICLGGGCAYNGTANGKILKETKFKRLWIPSAPSDAGSSIGACINYIKNQSIKTKRINPSPFLGPEFTNNQILSKIKNKNYVYFNSKSKLYTEVAKYLNMGKVIGWYDGRMEFGARALGNRSILADPRPDWMKDKINRVIKKREGFRPFAPMVIKEKQDIYYDVLEDVPYMNQVVNVRPEYVNKLKATTHIDGTARIQTVYKNNNIYKLLIEFEKLTGYPILLNTSFNVKDKTIVLTPEDALKTFYETEMDLLVMGRYLIKK